MDEQITDAKETNNEKIRSLRAAIDAKLHEQGIYEQIRDLVNSKIKVTEEQLIHDVLESEVVQQLLATVRSMELATPAKSTNHEEADDEALENDRDVFLYLRLSTGKAFVDQLVELEQDTKNADQDDVGLDEKRCPVGSVVTFFRVNVTFQTQRQTSRDIRCCVDPPFDEHFRFRVEKKRTRTARTRGGASYAVDVMAPWEALCLVEEPVQLNLVKVTKKLQSRNSNGTAQWRELSSELLAVYRMDWRRVLCSTLQLVHFPIQLTGIMKEPVGSLDIRADLLNCKRTPSIAHEARSFLNKEAIQRNASNHSFYKYAKQWWDEFRNDEYSQLLAQLGSRQRLVKMFAEDEEGRYRMICKFITPLRVPMAVRSPSEAARFVGLLPYESNALLGGGADETWRSIATVLSARKGDAQDHAILLASLLLGCGLDAFVCIGTISASKSASRFARGSQRSYEDRGSTEAGHVWVLTRGSSSSDVLLWEAVTGEKFAVNDSRAPRRRGYCAIDCVFNHRQFFANLQPRAWKLAESSFDFEDETCWKRMDENLIADLPFGQPQTALLPPDVSSASLLEQEWVATLRRAIATRRRAEGLVTRWSEELSFYLLPALNSYELERLYGVTQVDNLFFQQSVTNFVEEGHTFQGVPSMFSIESPDEALTAMASNPLVADILTLHARSAQFALAVRCFPYAEHTVAIWVMLAVSYPSKN
ncbi:centrosomal protein, putative [Phytophthora infestans T30-4]|uniref:Centrosomal protein, putative n=1 Tax=Phytophthora infestans (strain T30-4) TaxID=403677 RepID=D0NYU4_PHYIT|nr:centrosomal protein, putative [Phytophthora infestans T30-4]EEY68727.1 centrosomal protein, putative [Phytophthora infestans T30-4]|eukprot:XP_002997419.1 centrosomal protein, putative [Phytophthora infestans T30-4]